MTVSPEVRAPRREDAPSPAAFIVQEVGDVARPRRTFRPVTPPPTIPGSSGLLNGIANVIGWSRRGIDHVQDQIDRYGAVFRNGVAAMPVVSVADPAAVARILRNQDGAFSTALAWRVFLGGLDELSATADMPVTLDGVPHTEVRRLLQPAFSAQALAGYVDVASEQFEQSVDAWVAQGRVAFKPAARRLFADVANRIFMGVADSAEAERLDRAMSDFWKGFMALSKNPLLSPTWRRSQRGYRTLRDAFRAQVAERRTGDGGDLFSRICRHGESIAWVDDDALVRIFLGVMVAAFDTTSLGVTSMAYLLATHPEWQERLRAEAREAGAGRLTVEAARRLELHDRAWKESLRLFPVAPDVPRIALRDVELCGHTIPAGTFVVALLGPAMRDPLTWTAPLTFDPDRFAPERAEEKRQAGAFLPFGAGPHACIGGALSTLEAKAFWHCFLTRARITLARPYRAQHQFSPLGVVSGEVELNVQPVQEGSTGNGR